jgi:nucleoside-diphosphate-sugar epimerase
VNLAALIHYTHTHLASTSTTKLDNMKVFITGASGYVGGAVTTELISHGHTVIGLARSDASAQKISALGADVMRGDTDNLDSVRAGAAAADGVIHCAFDHDFSDFEGAMRRNNETIEAIGAVLAGTHKPFVISNGTLGLAGHESTEDDASPIAGFGAGRAQSEAITLALAEKGVRTSVIRLPPTVHGGNLKPSSFTRQMIAAARKHGFAGYVGDGDARWPAVDVGDAAVVYRLALEKGEPGSRYHAVADEGNRVRDLAEAIGAHLGVPMKPVPVEAAVPHFGFIGRLMGLDNPISSTLTRERLGWKPTQPGLIENLKAGKYFD